jgi:hypothetical protein
MVETPVPAMPERNPRRDTVASGPAQAPAPQQPHEEWWEWEQDSVGFMGCN